MLTEQSIKDFGEKGEFIIKTFLKKKGFKIFEIDMVAEKDGKYFYVEVKRKAERFKSPPFEGQGINKKQLKTRLEYEKRTGNKIYLIIIEEDTGLILGQWLEKLEAGKYFDTRNNIRIYPIESFSIVGRFR